MHSDPANYGSATRVEDQIGLPRPLIERLSVGVAVVDLEGQFLILNRAAAELFGLSEVVRSLEEAQKGSAVYVDESTEAAALNERPLSRVLAGEGSVTAVLRVRSTADARERRVSAHCHALRGEDGVLRGAAAIYEELDPAQNTSATLHSISRDLAHELNQPLTTISLYARGCIRRLKHNASEDDDMLEALEAINEQALRTGDIIRRARENSVWGPIQTRRTNLNLILNNMIDAARTRAAGAGCSIEVRLDDELSDCQIDEGRIRHLIWRLTEIGIEALPSSEPERTLLWSTRAVAGGAELRVSESITGSLDESASPFGAKMAERALCLTICRRIADEHGGQIDFDRDEAGSHAVLVLPISVEVEADGE